MAITDHSYDLDNMVQNYKKNDPELKKWQLFLAETAKLNQELEDFVIIPGEEVSVGNHKKQKRALLGFR